MVTLLVVTLAAPTAGAAGDSERVEALFLEGAAMYRAGRYGAAIGKFKEAYAIYPEANLLFNIARSYEAQGALEDAASYYSLFLKRPNISARLRAKAQRKLEVISNATKQTESAKPTGPPAASGAAPPTEPSSPAVAAPASPASPTRDINVGSTDVLTSPPAPSTVSARDPSDSPSLGVWKWSSGALAVATMAAGGVVLWLGERDHQDVRDAKDATNPSLTQRQADERIDAGSTKKIAGGVTLGAGALFAVISAVLFVLDDDSDEAAAGVGLVPTAGGSAVSFGGRF